MKKHVNYYFLGLSTFFIAFGLLFLSTLSAIASLQIFGNTNYYLFHQLVAVGIGLCGGLVAYKIPLPFLKKVAPIIFFINLAVLLFVFLPFIGTKYWGASRWIVIGPVSFQPSEFFKISAILYLSAWLASKFSQPQKKGWVLLAKRGYYNLTRIFLPFLILLAIISVALLLQRDLTTLGIISVSLIVIYFTAGTPLWTNILTLTIGSASAFIFIITKQYRLERLLIFLNPETDPLGMGFQLKQSLIAIGSGGIFGKGLGMSTQKFGFLPASMSDSLFAIFGEETGIIGCIILISLFVYFLWLGFKIANSATDTFSRLTATGITTWIVFQAFINIASTMGLFPLSGVPLPFFSYGGSHIIAEIIGIGLLLNISKNG